MSFWKQLFGSHHKELAEKLQEENTQLKKMNASYMATIEQLSRRMADSLDRHVGLSQEISKRLQLVDTLPARQDAVQEKVQDSFDKATFFIQNAVQDLVYAKNHLVGMQNEILDTLSAIDIADLARQMLVSTWLNPLSASLLQLQGCTEDALEHWISQGVHTMATVNAHMHQINTRLDRYQLRLEECVYRPLNVEMYQIDSTKQCDLAFFQRVVRLCQQHNLCDPNQDISRLRTFVLAETQPAISAWNAEKGMWIIKRRGKVSLLRCVAPL